MHPIPSGPDAPSCDTISSMETGQHRSPHLTGALKGMLVQPKRLSAMQWLMDAAIACGAFGFGMLQMTLSVNLFLPDEFTRLMLGIQSITPSAFAIMGVLLTCLPLIVRQKLPWVAFAACVGAWVAFAMALQIATLALVGPLVALFTVAYERSRMECVIAALILLACVLASPVLIPAAHSPFDNLMLFMNAMLVVAVSLAGYAFHVREDFLEAAETRAVQAERIQEVERLRAEEACRTADAEASRRVEAERLRIAREVHDITAHSLSAVSIQAALALRLMDSDPDSAKEAMELARKTSKDALSEMRAMIGVLRDGAADRASEPTHGTDRLGDLIDYLEAAGVRASLDEERYDRSRVPAYIDIALFGIAREAVTNIVRHAGATHAQIALALMGGAAVLEVADDGCGGEAAKEADAPMGHGIQGMRERVGVLGGRMEAAPLAEGGFSVRVSIPLAGQGSGGGR